MQSTSGYDKGRAMKPIWPRVKTLARVYRDKAYKRYKDFHRGPFRDDYTAISMHCFEFGRLGTLLIRTGPGCIPIRGINHWIRMRGPFRWQRRGGRLRA